LYSEKTHKKPYKILFEIRNNQTSVRLGEICGLRHEYQGRLFQQILEGLDHGRGIVAIHETVIE